LERYRNGWLLNWLTRCLGQWFSTSGGDDPQIPSSVLLSQQMRKTVALWTSELQCSEWVITTSLLLYWHIKTLIFIL